ncbi:MAG: response regulator [Lachnospiraceae bacterium]|nr:response regulator [Lachnospiraceae bacterium]
MEYLPNLAHDVRTSMGEIIGLANLGLNAAGDTVRTRDCLLKIRSASEHLMSQLNDIMEMSRIEGGKLVLNEVACDIGAIAEKASDIAAAYAADKLLKFGISTDRVSDRWVYCDTIRFERVLNNLLSNAVKYTPENGEVRLSLVQTECEREGYGRYELKVRDSGAGMNEEFVAEIFDAYGKERSSTIEGLQGTGLGMAITKKIVDAMGGGISVKSELGKGSEFTVVLELRLAEALQDDEEWLTENAYGDEGSRMDFRGERILLVDDNNINRQIARGILKAYGFVIDDAENGQEAVEKIEGSESGYYDLVLMDVRMPVMNGYEATRKIRAMEDETKAKLPVIAMTANSFEEDIKAAKDVGMDAHIAKPIEIPVMMEVLSDILNNRKED